MEPEFPYIKIPKGLRRTIGPPDPGTRIFRTEGSVMVFVCWLQELADDLKGDLIPAQWAPDLVGVSRAAVHKRAKQGKLTMFVYTLQEMELNLLFRDVVRNRNEFAYYVRSECEAWREEIILRKARRGPPELFN